MIIRLLFFLLLVYFFTKMLKKLFVDPRRQKGKQTVPPRGPRSSLRPVDEMVQDPVCHVYLTKKDALTAVVDGKTYYFCSPKCRDTFSTR
ncbi:MAG: YHS domain-containing protein [Deltaproteobacteria bacterium]|nr:YHS domain-containing protein [Deltaproteobacteria bacterium]